MPRKPKKPEITAETLQNISFEIIAKLVTWWRNPKEAGAKFESEMERLEWSIDKALRIHDKVSDAMRFHPDIEKLADYAKKLDELEQRMKEDREEFAISRKIKPLATTRSTEQGGT